MTDDAELLRRYAEEKSEEAFAEFVQRSINLVYAAALRRTAGDPHAAADVAQRVFLAAARHARELSRHPRLTGWLYSATRNTAINLMRDEQRRQRQEREAHTQGELLGLNQPSADWTELRPVIDAAMDELGDDDREAVLLRFFDGRPFADVAQRLRLTENAARMRVERALDKLHTQLARRGVTSTAAALAVVLANEAAASAPGGLAANVTAGALQGVGAGATTSVAAGLSLMSTLKVGLGLVGAVLLIALLGSAGMMARANAVSGQALATDQAHVRALAKEARDREQQAAQAESRRADAQRALDTLRAKRAAAEAQARLATKAEEAPVFDPTKAGDAFMARHPEVKSALGDYGRARVNFRFGELFRKLGLSAAQIEQFQGLAMRGGMGSEGVDGHEMQLVMTPTVPHAEREEALAQLLGTEGYRQYLEIEQRDHTRDLTVHIAGALWATETPLTPAQADQLTEVFLKEHANAGNGSFARVDWEGAIAKAATFLSAPQLAMLESEWTHDREIEAMNRPMSARAEAAPGK